MSSIKIPVENANILEVHIEDWLYQNPQEFIDDYFRSFEWVGRQVRLPAGIIDLLGCYTNIVGMVGLLVVEVKRGPIDDAALTQVCRYAESLDYVMGTILHAPDVEKMVVGLSIGDKEFESAQALGVSVRTFTPTVSLVISRVHWTSIYKEKLSEQAAAAGNSPAIADVVKALEQRGSIAIFSHSLSTEQEDIEY